MPPGKLIALTSPKGGSGSTCVSINLAAAIAKLPETNVGLIDFGTPLGDIAAYLGLKPTYSVIDALDAGERLDSVLLNTFMSSKGKFQVLTGSTEFKSSLEASRKSMDRLVEVVSRSFTHTVLDLSLHLSNQMLDRILHIADDILVVITAEVPSVWSALRFLYFVEDLGRRDSTRVVLNRNLPSAQIRPKDIEKLLEEKIFHALPNDYRAMVQAVNSGQSLIEVNSSNLSQSFMSLAEKVTGIKQHNSRKKIFQFFS